MSFIISGDTHGMIDIGKIVKFFDEHEGEYTSEDYLIICGDVGVCGFSASEEAETRSVLRNLPVTILFVKPQIISGDFRRLFQTETPVTVCGQ